MRIVPRPLLTLAAVLAAAACAPAPAGAAHGATALGADRPAWVEDDGAAEHVDDGRTDGEALWEDDAEEPEEDGDGVAPPAPPVAAPAPPPASLPVVTGRLVPGTRARLRTDGRAAVPRGAPRTVRRLVAALNEIAGKPYVWGGGHARLLDRGYDCSGAVSYGLVRTGLLPAPLVSGALARWGARGAGRWVSIYANRGHVYLEVAGLRLDTSPVGDPRGERGPRWRPVIGRRPGFVARHPAGL